jgi:D-serine deaminase-like pyridoxal phosphate-dependent protein
VTPDPLERVETPVAVIDLARVRRNAERVAAYCRSHGLRWRPHIKTHKSARVAAIQLASGATGLTVATLREAEVMSGVTDDLLLAYPPIGAPKLERLMALPPGVRLTVALDSEEALVELARAASRSERTVDVLVEMDMGLRRVGVETPAEAVRLAGVAAGLHGVRYAGVMFYPGHIRLPGDRQDPLLRALGDRLAKTLDALDEAHLPAAVVSGGSTPTLWKSHQVARLTEVRAGSCIFNDLEGLALGAADPEDLAYSVLATVVSTAVRGQAVVDAGSKALSKELPSGQATYGAVLDRPEVRVSALSEEHGVLDLSGSDWRPRVGERVRIVPNHVCVSVNLQDFAFAREGDGEGEVWELEARGRGRYAPTVTPAVAT